MQLSLVPLFYQFAVFLASLLCEEKWFALDRSGERYLQIDGCFLHLLSGGMSWVLLFIFSGQNTVAIFVTRLQSLYLISGVRVYLHLNTGLLCVVHFACVGASAGSLTEQFG